MSNQDYIKISSQLLSEKSGLLNKGRKFLRYSVINLLSKLSYRTENNFLRCMYFHNVFDDQTDTFEKFITKLMGIGTFIDSTTLVKMIKGEIEIDGRYFHLSFDDGFKNNYTNAVPILIRYAIPCLFFIPTAIIDSSKEVINRYCLHTTKYGGLIEILTWEDLREMISLGFEIGSHTRNHSNLASISSDFNLLQDEVLGSKNEIEKNLDVECKYLSWPFGCHSDINEDSLKIIEDSCYHACFGAFRGTIIKNKTNIFQIPRHDINLQDPIAHNEYFLRGNMEIKSIF